MTRLGDLIEGLAADAADITVGGLAIDHRKVVPGAVFGAFPGSTFNGEDFIADAVRSGAIAIVARPQANVAGAVHIASDDPRATFAKLAARYFNRFPQTCVAVTGTNGKTSTVELTRQLWRLAGHASASIGTLGVTTSNDVTHTGLTTPDIVTFLSNMAGLAQEGVTHAAFEASSHGLDQMRVGGLPVAAGAFTNLTRDHLDYHGTMEAYCAAKLRLFDTLVSADGAAVIWADGSDPAQTAIRHAEQRGLRTLTVGPMGDTLRLTRRTPTALGQTVTVSVGGEDITVQLPLIGAYQVANALVAAGLVIATDGDTRTTLKNLDRVQPVRGRLERAAITAAGAAVYVDYAHTPDGLRAALEALREHTAGKLTVVFGAGGDRDVGKRPEMGTVAAALADRVIVTDDNPRGEDPATIRAAILAAVPGAEDIGDRRSAIAAAIAGSADGDVICVAGKGHEQGQIVGSGDGRRVLPFDDASVVREMAG